MLGVQQAKILGFINMLLNIIFMALVYAAFFFLITVTATSILPGILDNNINAARFYALSLLVIEIFIVLKFMKNVGLHIKRWRRI